MGEGPIAQSRRKRLRPYIAAAAVVALGVGAAAGASVASAATSKPGASPLARYVAPKTVPASVYLHAGKTATPIKHVVVIFDENISFDHYFGTYPDATNTDGTPFVAKPGTPGTQGSSDKVTNLLSPVNPAKKSDGNYLTNNPNEYAPQRLTPAEALTTDNNHSYTPEQDAENNGKMDQFVQDTQGSTAPTGSCGPEYCPPGIVMDYYDGNTVTAMWNYAQYYSMSDNNWDTTFGPSSPGAVGVTSGLYTGAKAVNPIDDTSGTPGAPASSSSINDVNSSTGLGTLNGDIDPYFDDCSDTNHTSNSPTGILTGENIGDLLNAKDVSWGWFEGGFTPTSSNAGGAVCGSEHENVGGVEETDYVPHHDPFQFYASTANPDHKAPSALSAIGYTDQANHQYDMSYFGDALNGTGGAKLPAVSYLKPPAYQDGHPGNSDPTDEQTFVVNEINQIEKSKYWPSTAIVITYDDSDGWYDQVAPKITNGSNTSQDTAECADVAVTVGTAEGECGPSQRLPMLVISPYSRENYVSNNLTDTTSVVKFIEDNWLKGERIPGSFDAAAGSIDAPGGMLDFQQRPNDRPVILNPTTGAVVSGGDWYGNEGKKNKN